MKVTGKLHGFLAKYSKSEGPEFTVELVDDATVLELLATLEVPEEKVRLVFINNRQKKKLDTLNEGDCIKCVPYLPGG